MARPLRCDGPGVWHHVMNRGIARRTVFEDIRDIRFFLSRIARAVRSGWIEVHAYCILTTHFHLLVRSSEGVLSHAMARVLDDYVRWFNRGRMRDGPLFRGRFRSRPVDSYEYRHRLVLYIDSNSVEAGLSPSPALYPHGSARWHARHRGPPWLERGWIESEVMKACGLREYDPRRYPDAFGTPVSPALARLIERRIESGARGPDPLDDLVGAAPQRVLSWMVRKAALADGTRVDLQICDPEVIAEVVTDERRARANWRIPSLRPQVDAWQLVELALLRDLAACSFSEIGSRLQWSQSRILRAYRGHADALVRVDEYARVVAEVAASAISRCFGVTVPGSTASPTHRGNGT
jgi:hypothetical protein